MIICQQGDILHVQRKKSYLCCVNDIHYGSREDRVNGAIHQDIAHMTITMWLETVPGHLHVPFIVEPGLKGCLSGPGTVRSPLALRCGIAGLVIRDNGRWRCIKAQCETPQL